MSDMKCPFCNGELERVYSRPFQLICGKCGSLGTDELWQELIRTRKALDKAKWWLHEIVESHRCTPISTAEKALKEITTLDKGGDNE